MYDYLVIGAGLAGSTMAERLASVHHASVLVVDRRDHVAGNAHDDVSRDGVTYHAYGPHIFHTNAARVVEYLSLFTAWRPYEHRVLSRVRGKLVPVPINRTTINTLYGLSLSEAQVERFLAQRAESFPRIDDSERKIRSRVGAELYELFFRGYTRKQWGRDASQLDATVCGRIPTRTSDDDRYFGDSFQAMPAAGYTALVRRMLAHPRIDVLLNIDYRTLEFRARKLVVTAPIDEFYGYKYGKLPYRSLRFELETHAAERVQPVACINEPSEDVAYTRTTEYKHLTGQQHAMSVISREYPVADGDPYYPIPCRESREMHRRYEALASHERFVTFAGRLGEYKYYNIDQVVASALAKVDRLAVETVA